MNSQQAAERAGITYRQLDTWTTKGWLTASGGGGTGHARDFTYQQVNKARTMKKLIDMGFTPAKAHEICMMSMEEFGEFFEQLKRELQ